MENTNEPVRVSKDVLLQCERASRTREPLSTFEFEAPSQASRGRTVLTILSENPIDSVARISSLPAVSKRHATAGGGETGDVPRLSPFQGGNMIMESTDTIPCITSNRVAPTIFPEELLKRMAETSAPTTTLAYERDRTWLFANYVQIERDHPDQWVVILDENVVASGSDLGALLDKMGLDAPDAQPVYWSTRRMPMSLLMIPSH